MRKFDEYCARKFYEYGDEFVPPTGTEFIKAYESQARVEVTGPCGVRRGRISVTTGWQPVFLLMHRVSDHGSWDTLSEKDKITRVIDSREAYR